MSSRPQPVTFQPRRPWSDYSRAVQALRPELVAWLERMLPRRVTAYSGSDSVRYRPHNWSKYKLIPYDNQRRSPITVGEEGVLVCLDYGECERTFGGSPSRRPGPARWHGTPIRVTVAGNERTYWAARFDANQPRAQRRICQNAVGSVIQRIEGR